MLPYTDQFQPVTVIVRTAGLARYVSFEMSLESLNVPLNTHVARSLTANLAGSLNDILKNLVTPYVWVIDDDHQFDNFILLRLMAHDKPVVNGLTLMARPPFHCVAYRKEVMTEGTERWSPTFELHAEDLMARLKDGDGVSIDDFKTLVREAGFKRNSKKFLTWTWKDFDDQTGLFPVFACGLAGMLIKREVFDELQPPWFELGQTNPEEVGEDVYFCEKLRASKFAIQTPDGPCAVYIDLDTVFGHTSPATAWPTRREDGSWTIRLQWDNGHNIVINRPDRPPMILPTQADIAESSRKSQSIVERAQALQRSGMSEADAFQMAVQEAEKVVEP